MRVDDGVLHRCLGFMALREFVFGVLSKAPPRTMMLWECFEVMPMSSFILPRLERVLDCGTHGERERERGRGGFI